MKITIFKYTKFIFSILLRNLSTYLILLLSLLLICLGPIIHVATSKSSLHWYATPLIMNLFTLEAFLWILGLASFSIFIIWSIFYYIENSNFKLVVLTKGVNRKTVIYAKFFTAFILLLIFSFVHFFTIVSIASIGNYEYNVNPWFFSIIKVLESIIGVISLFSIFLIMSLFLKKIILLSSMFAISALIGIGTQFEVPHMSNMQEHLRNVIDTNEKSIINENLLKNENIYSVEEWIVIEKNILNDIKYINKKKTKSMLFLSLNFYSQWSTSFELPFYEKMNFADQMIAMQYKNFPVYPSNIELLNISQNSLNINIEENNYFIEIEENTKELVTTDQFKWMLNIFNSLYPNFTNDTIEGLKKMSYSSTLLSLQNWLVEFNDTLDTKLEPEIKSFFEYEENDGVEISYQTIVFAENIYRHFEKQNQKIFNKNDLYLEDEIYKLNSPLLNNDEYFMIKYKFEPIFNAKFTYAIWVVVWIISTFVYAYAYVRKDLN